MDALGHIRAAIEAVKVMPKEARWERELRDADLELMVLIYPPITDPDHNPADYYVTLREVRD